MWRRQRMIGTKTFCPSKHVLVRNEATRVCIVERFPGQTIALFFLANPCRQSLLDNPSARAFKPRRHLIHFIGQGKWDVRR